MSRRRKICYITGTRADFGLMQSTLQRIHQSEALELSVIATGMHLSPQHGLTIRQIESTGFAIAARIEVEEGISTGALMARNIGRMLIGFVDAIQSIRPDIVLLLGDRGEMLAGALAAAHLNIPVVHVHGGERSGTIDESVRHAISKLAHFHFVATEESKARLVRMGEVAGNVYVVGAPGLDGLKQAPRSDRKTLCAGVGFDPARKIALLVYHPVLQEADKSGEYATLIVSALLAKGLQTIALNPNSDAGSAGVRAAFDVRAAAGDIHLVTHLPRPEFISWLAAADVMVGNSSSGIIEAASFGTPVINVGSRQNLRQRNDNVIEVRENLTEIDAALEHALATSRFPEFNVYGDGRSGDRIARLLTELDISERVLQKVNSY